VQQLSGLPTPQPSRPFLCDQLAVHSMGFDAVTFSDAAFAKARIDYPGTIRNAVLKRQAEFFYGRYCAQHALGNHQVQVGIGAHREPIWPPGVVGSISHTGSMAAAAVLPASQCRGLGIDLESLAQGATLMSMRDLFIDATEWTCLQSLPALEPLHALVIAFSVKESFFKAVFSQVGEFFDFDAIKITAIDLERQLVTFRVQRALCGQFLPGVVGQAQFCQLTPDHVLTAFCW
jgi:enterobactin synthetase component D